MRFATRPSGYRALSRLIDPNRPAMTTKTDSPLLDVSVVPEQDPLRRA